MMAVRDLSNNRPVKGSEVRVFNERLRVAGFIPPLKERQTAGPLSMEQAQDLRHSDNENPSRRVPKRLVRNLFAFGILKKRGDSVAPFRGQAEIGQAVRIRSEAHSSIV
jgi:hypothetical protein